MAYKNPKLVHRIREAGLTKEQMNAILRNKEATQECGIIDALRCALGLEGYFYLIF
jgi:hypothetical protein